MNTIYGAELWQDYEIVEAIQRWADKHGRPPSGFAWRNSGYGHPSVMTVRDHFGTMAKALRAAGFEAHERKGGYPSYWTRDLIAEAMLDHLLLTGNWPTEREWSQPHNGPRTGGAPRPSTGTVRRLFGTWTQAKRYAGWEPVKERQPRAARLRATPLGWRCSGCGTDNPDTRTLGCGHCADRHKKRRRRRAPVEVSPLLSSGGTPFPTDTEVAA